MNYNYGGYWQEPRQNYLQGTQMSLPNQQVNNDERIWVNGEAQARDYLIAPNGFVRLWDSNEPKFYEKRADASGRPFLKAYGYHEIETATDPKTVPNGFNEEELKKEIEALKRRITALEKGDNDGEQ